MRLLPIAHALAVLSSLAAAQLGVVSTSPLLNASNCAPNDSISVDFDRPVLSNTLSSFQVYGNMSGPIAGVRTLENGDTRVRFRPRRAFFAGETVTTTLNENLAAQDGSLLRTQGFVFSFRVKAAPAPMQFTPFSTIDVSPGASFARIYGGQNCDLNGDDFLDLAVVTEIANDVRVYLSNHDGTGLFGPMAGGA